MRKNKNLWFIFNSVKSSYSTKRCMIFQSGFNQTKLSQFFEVGVKIMTSHLSQTTNLDKGIGLRRI